MANSHSPGLRQRGICRCGKCNQGGSPKGVWGCRRYTAHNSAGFPRFEVCWRRQGRSLPHVTSFRCRVHGKLAGPNWLVVGEAASMVDPLTSNGVTAALRQAAEAAELIIKKPSPPATPIVGSGGLQLASCVGWRACSTAALSDSSLIGRSAQGSGRSRPGMCTPYLHGF